MQGWNDYIQDSYVYDMSDTWEQIIHGSVQSIGNMLPAIGVGALTGGLGSMAMFGATAMGGGVEGALQEGHDFQTATNYGILEAGKELATEAIGGKLFGSKLFGVFGEMTGKTGARSLIKSVAKEALGEGAEEVLGDVFEPFIQKITISKDEKLMDLVGDSIRQMPMDFIAGALTGSVMNGGSIVTNIALNGTDGVKQQMVVSEAHEVMQDAIKAEKKGNLTDEMKAEAKAKLDNLYEEFKGYSEKIKNKFGEGSKKALRSEALQESFSKNKDNFGEILTYNQAQGGKAEIENVGKSKLAKDNNFKFEYSGAIKRDEYREIVKEVRKDKFQESDVDSNAFIVSGNKIYFNKDSEAYKNGEIYSTLGHEILHSIENTPEYQEIYSNYVSNLSTEKKGAILEEYRNKRGYTDLTEEQIYKEALADYVGKNVAVNREEFARMLGTNSKWSKLKDKLFGYRGILSGDMRELQLKVNKALKTKISTYDAKTEEGNVQFKESKSLVGKTFPFYKESKRSDSNTFSTEWAFNKDVDELDRKIMHHNGAYYLIEKADDLEFKYFIVHKFTAKEYKELREKMKEVEYNDYKIRELFDEFGSFMGRRTKLEIDGGGQNTDSLGTEYGKENNELPLGIQGLVGEKTRTEDDKSINTSSLSNIKTNNVIQNVDSKGNRLSEKVLKFFKHSKIRDEKGRLLVVYHGTKNGTFTIFDSKSYRKYVNLLGEVVSGINEPNTEFFSDSEQVANSYTENGNENNKVYAVYLNITNPLIIDAEGKGFKSLLTPYARKQLKDFNEIKESTKRINNLEVDKNLLDIGKLISSSEVVAKIMKMTDEEKNKFLQENIDDFLLHLVGNLNSNVEGKWRFVNENNTLVLKNKTNKREYKVLTINKKTINEKIYFFKYIYENISKKISEITDVKNLYRSAQDIADSYSRNFSDKTSKYDGIIIKNVVDYGENSTSKREPSNVYVAFNSNQIKNVTNEAPTKDLDINFSRSSKPAETKTENIEYKNLEMYDGGSDNFELRYKDIKELQEYIKENGPMSRDQFVQAVRDRLRFSDEKLRNKFNNDELSQEEFDSLIKEMDDFSYNYFNSKYFNIVNDIVSVDDVTLIEDENNKPQPKKETPTKIESREGKDFLKFMKKSRNSAGIMLSNSSPKKQYTEIRRTKNGVTINDEQMKKDEQK
jgi:hypothetical protein